MFTTKLEVDKHVENNLKKINNEKERNLRGYAFAKLYYKVGDYESARRFVSAYLHVKASADAYNLLGKSLEKLERYDAALEAYRRSFELDSKQNNLLIKICELLALENSNFDLSGARYYCEKAQKIDPHNPVLYSLKEKIISLESNSPNDVTKLYLTELETQPANVSLRIKLVQHLLQNNEIREAYKQVSDLEHKNLPSFTNSLAWFEISAEVLLRFQRDNLLGNNLTWEFWLLFISILDKLAALGLDERFSTTKSSTDCLTSVFNFDQALYHAVEKLKDCPEKSLIQECLNHYKGQLCLYLATLLFKQAKKNLLQFKEACRISLPFLFIAYHTQPPDLRSIWLDHADDKHKRLIQRWHIEATYRCSQAGHLLLSAAKDRQSILLEKTQQICTGLWREQIFKKLFVTRDQQAKLKGSFFVNSPLIGEVAIILPNKNDIVKHDQVSQLLYPNSLHHHIWIGLNSKLSSFNCTVFSGLPYSAKHLDNSSAESLSLLDVQAFLYCATLCAQTEIEQLKRNTYDSNDKPDVLPAAVTNQLGTPAQNKWFTIVYKMYKKEYASDLVELRVNIVKGLEVVRCIGNHGLDVKLLIELARIFTERAKISSRHSEVEANDSRAELYWKTALTILERLKNKQAVVYAKDRLFEYKTKAMNPEEIFSSIAEAQLFMGTRLLKNKDYERALNLFETLRSPYASFYQFEIYQAMAEDLLNQNREKITSEIRSQYVILLTRARDSLYLTLDRLREPSADRNHPLNGQLSSKIEKIERLLSKYDSDINGYRVDYEGLPEENFSFVGSTGDNVNRYTNTSFSNGISTPKRDYSHSTYLTPRMESSFREARPSPERLDAQLRQMQAARDNTLSQILEQNRIMVDSLKEVIRTTVDELKSVKSSVEELKGIKQTMNELKNAVDDLQNFANITDMVHEMKKEIAELKSNSNKTKANQLSDEDLCVLDEDYGGDYTFNSNLGTLNQGLYPGLQNRVPGANPLSYTAALYHGMYPPLYPFPGLSLPQAGTLPFGQESQLPDFRGVTQNLSQTQPVYNQQTFNQTGLNQPILGQQLSSQGLNQFQFPHLNVAQQSITQSATLNQAAGLTGAPLMQSGVLRDSRPEINISSAVLPSSLQSSSYTSASTFTSKAPPVNVVITASDPLPKTTTQTTQILSVTIPPQHLKGNLPPKSQPHGYQIPVPSSTLQTAQTTPSFVQTARNIPSTVQTLNMQTTKPLIPQSLPTATVSAADDKSIGKSNTSNSSVTSLEEHDPYPDFKPIIPLPDEVPLNTGEENETVLFCQRAKLFRYVNKEWKERGIGNLKILKNNTTGKLRILMRREQVLKICANHFITKEMNLTPMPNSDKAYMWVANDFADEELVLEKLCVRFKTAEEAKAFFDAFETAKKSIPATETDVKQVFAPSKPELKQEAKKESTQTPQTQAFGGFVFTSTPTFKVKEVTAVTAISQQETPKTTPFASFSFIKSNVTTTASPLSLSSLGNVPTSECNKSSLNVTQTSAGNDDSHAEDFQPNVEFKPLVPLPDLVDVKTGEEGSEILFQCRAKLLRFDPSNKEWKERGVGDIKILKDKTIRLVMRREQVLKVCCNHQLFKSTTFTKMNTHPKALTWYAQDFSDGVLKPEMFAIKFKTEEQTNEFHKAILAAQELLDENNIVKEGKQSKEQKELSSKNDARDDKKIKSGPPEPSPKTEHTNIKQGFGDKFKPKSGSWECKNCYIVNEAKDSYCVACETPKTGTTPKKSDTGASGPQFSFGCSPSGGFLFGQKSETSTTATLSEGSKSSLSTLQFSPAVVTTCPSTVNQSSSLWGDAFKPKPGSWSCSACLVRNDSDKKYCVACETPKDDSIPKKEINKSISLDTSGLKFSFGIPASSSNPSFEILSSTAVSTSVLFGTSAKTTAASSVPNFGFGVTSFSTANTTAPFSFGSSSFTFSKPKISDADVVTSESTSSNNKPFNFSLTTPKDVKKEHEDTKEKFVFGSPQKYTFDFTPRSPRRQSSGQGEEESDSNYVEDEGDHIYFKPVIPLPDKIEVKTGEEEEEVLYCHRAKLFRFVQGEWKERGLGDLKILLRRDTGKLRVLMRREQILKICLNHTLTSDIEYLLKDERTWLFSAPDFSEGEINHGQFCLRFKNSDVAKEFKKAVEDALKISFSKTVGGGDNKRFSSEADSDVEFISETTVTSEEEKEALRLGLPPKFLSYRQLPDCTCDTCKKDDELLAPLFKSEVLLQQQSRPTSDVKPKSPLTIFGAKDKASLASPKFVFGTQPVTTAASTTFSFGSVSTPTSTNADTLKTILTKPSMLDNFAKDQLKKDSDAGSVVVSTSEKTPASTFTFSFKTSVQSSPFTTALTSTNTFGAPITAASQSNIFSTTTSSIFGMPPATTITFGTSGSLFGNSTTASSSFVAGPVISATNAFGKSSENTNVTTSTTSIFNTTSSGLFGTPKSLSVSGNIFNTPITTTFGGNIFGGTAAPGIVFGSKIVDKSEEKVDTKTTEKTDNETGQLTKEPEFLNVDPGLSFASLAAASQNISKDGDSDKKTGSGTTSNKEDKQPFAFLGAGTPVFASIVTKAKSAEKKKKDKNKTDSGDEDENENEKVDVEEEYDPHYEPIVPLPEQITVSTGEEEETILFNERAKLYRFDTNAKEWKERGVGSLKLLHHPEKGTYRLLLRREQVHKLVLNMLIIADLELQPMNTSDKAWLWCGYNHSMDGSALEKLAARFKTIELAKKFYDAVVDAIAAVKKQQESRTLPSSVQSFGENESTENEEGEKETNDAEDSEVEDEEDDRSAMFSKHCTLSEELDSGEWKNVAEGELEVYYDSNIYGARISMTDDKGEIVSSTMICVNTKMEQNDQSCTWKAVEWAADNPYWRNLRATFASAVIAEEFYYSYLEGLQYAQGTEIYDGIYLENTNEEDEEEN